MWVSGASGPTTCSSMQVFSTHITLLGSSSSSSSDSSLLLELLDSLRLFFAFFFLDFLDLLGNSLLSLSVPSCVNDAAFYSRLWTLTFCSSFSFSSSLFLLLKDKNTRSADEYKNTLLSFLKIMWRWTHHLNLIPGRCPQSAFCSFSSWISSFSFSSSSLLWMTDNILLLTQTTEFCWYFKVFVALWFIWYLFSFLTTPLKHQCIYPCSHTLYLLSSNLSCCSSRLPPLVWIHQSWWREKRKISTSRTYSEVSCLASSPYVILKNKYYTIHVSVKERLLTYSGSLTLGEYPQTSGQPNSPILSLSCRRLEKDS